MPTYRAVEAVPEDAVAARLADLSDRPALITAQADSPERRAMISERDALAERKWLATVEADAVAEIGRAKSLAALNVAAQDTQTTKITNNAAM